MNTTRLYLKPFLNISIILHPPSDGSSETRSVRQSVRQSITKILKHSRKQTICVSKLLFFEQQAPYTGIDGHNESSGEKCTSVSGPPSRRVLSCIRPPSLMRFSLSCCSATTSTLVDDICRLNWWQLSLIMSLWWHCAAVTSACFWRHLFVIYWRHFFSSQLSSSLFSHIQWLAFSTVCWISLVVLLISGLLRPMVVNHFRNRSPIKPRQPTSTEKCDASHPASSHSLRSLSYRSSFLMCAASILSSWGTVSSTK